MYGSITMGIKLPCGDSAGTVTTFYVSHLLFKLVQELYSGHTAKICVPAAVFSW